MNLSNCVCGFAWKVDLKKFRIYLKYNYGISEGYYMMGYLDEENQELYTEIQLAGFVLLFKEHNRKLITKKKGNVDSDIIFESMKTIIERKDSVQFLIVSGDGDYI